MAGNYESLALLIKKGMEMDIEVSEILNSRDATQRLPIYTAIDTNNIKLLEVLTSEGIGLQMTKNDVKRAARYSYNHAL